MLNIHTQIKQGFEKSHIGLLLSLTHTRTRTRTRTGQTVISRINQLQLISKKHATANI